MKRSSFDFLLGTLVVLVFAQTPAQAQNMLNPENAELRKGSVVNDADTLDYRHSEMWLKSVPNSTAAVTEWFDALARKDLPAMADRMHFPFTMLEENRRRVIASRQEFLRNPPETFARALATAQYYETLDGIETQLFRPGSVCFFLSTSRYDGSGLARLRGDLVVNLEVDGQGRWGVRNVSTIYQTPDRADQAHQEAEAAAQRIVTLHMYSYGARSQELHDSISDVPRQLNYDEFFRMSGSKMGGYHNSIATRIDVVHHSDTKAHAMTTFVRRREDGTPITILRTLYVIAKIDGEWKRFAVAGQAREHDFSNDQ